jgi:hypothetical protein
VSRAPLVVALGAALLGAAPRGGRAQANTGEVLREARDLYERLEIERALPLLRQVVSPQWPFEVTREERVDAYRYLGASLALAGKRDSAVLYFRAAMDWDPFTDLDAARFTPAQIALFGEARRRTFAVGVRPVTAGRVDPRTERVVFTLVTTHAAALQATIFSADSARRAELFRGETDGLRELRWDGLLADGRLAPPGRYQLVLAGRSSLGARTDSARIFFGVAHDLEPLEDTLPPIDSASLLPETHPPAAARRELLTGLGVAALVLVIAGAVTNDDLGGDTPETAKLLAGAAAGTGLVTFIARRRRPYIAENVAENQRRMAERIAANDAIRQRNAERVARTTLLIEPAAGVEP